MSIITQNAALQGLLAAHLPALAEYEGLTPEAITSAIEAGTMVLLGNPNHANVKPILVGQPSRVKVNANIGTSPFQNHPGCEMRKLEVAQEAGADTVMDLSIAGDLVAIRKDMLSRTPRHSARCRCTRWRSATSTRIAIPPTSIPKNCSPKSKCRRSRAWTS